LTKFSSTKQYRDRMAVRRTLGFAKKQSFLKECHTKWTDFTDKIRNFETPERFKDTFVERWGKYWRNVYLDYHEVAVDVVSGCKERPFRASIYASILGGTYYCANHNPDEMSYREQYLQNTMKVVPVGDKVRNPITVEHIKFLERCYNENTVRRLNLGILSLIWIDNYDSNCAHYKATCKYLKPQYLKFHQRIIDVGFLDTWWVSESKMKDYDVNEEEFWNTNTVNSLS